jgi:hypothetical protein
MGYDHFVTEGIVTGGNYNELSGCMPYLIKPAHEDDGAPTPYCLKGCLPNHFNNYADDRFQGQRRIWLGLAFSLAVDVGRLSRSCW